MFKTRLSEQEAHTERKKADEQNVQQQLELMWQPVEEALKELAASGVTWSTRDVSSQGFDMQIKPEKVAKHRPETISYDEYVTSSTSLHFAAVWKPGKGFFYEAGERGSKPLRASERLCPKYTLVQTLDFQEALGQFLNCLAYHVNRTKQKAMPEWDIVKMPCPN